jgi:diacylglycerol kinase (ATP)
MRLSLLFNQTAGEGTTLDEICRLVKRHGHSLGQILEKHDSLEQSVTGDALIAAGGDGTVATAARLVASGQRPLAILPMGTANNIAKSLGVQGSLDDIVDRWGQQEPRSVDLGFVGGPWGVGRFIEAVGAGLVAEGICNADTRRRNGGWVDKPSVLEGANLYLETLSAVMPTRSTIEADGETIEGEFLLIEVLNMPLVGANLRFSSDADPGDGLLSIVAIGGNEREALHEYLAQRANDRDALAPFVSRKAAHVNLKGWPGLHVDDAYHRVDPQTPTSIEIDPGVLRVL